MTRPKKRLAATAEAARLLSPGARLYLGRMARALSPHARAVEAFFRAFLRNRKCGPREVKALLSITPVAAARLLLCGPTARFLEQAAYNGRRLAMLNVPLVDVLDILQEFDAHVDRALGGMYQPPREQLRLVTALTLNAAYYEVHESEAQAFFGLYEAESRAKDLDDLLRRAVRVLARAFGARTSRVVIPANVPPKRFSKPLYAGGDSPRAAEFPAPELTHGCRSWWSYPIQAAGRTVGMMQFGFASEFPWLPREGALLGAAAARCGRAIDRARLVERLAERERAMRQLAAEAHRAEEEERRRIGRELHDETAQSLLLLRLQLEMLQRGAPPGLRAPLEDARATVERDVLELRRIIAALSPAVLERLGLQAALRQMAERFRSESGAGLRVRISARADALPQSSQQVIYRVAQECLQNASRHSGASHVNLWLAVADRSVRLGVSDDGAGFDAEAALSQRTSFGLAGMRERAALLGGELEITGEPGKGSTIKLKLPLDSAAGGSHGKNTHTTN